MTQPKMIPLGYMFKSVASPPPAWITAAQVRSVHSVSNCVSPDFVDGTDYVNLWQHNDWWFFNSPADAGKAAEALGVQHEPLTLFYYEAFEHQFNDGEWGGFDSEGSFTSGVVVPDWASVRASGFDVVTYSCQTTPECSPLSCNALASIVPTNTLCLFDTFEEARSAIDTGAFKDGEPGPYRIVAVYHFSCPT